MCDFCFRVTSYRIRPFDDILDEMESLMDRYRLDGFYIVDDLLMPSERKITDFCEGVLERGLRIRYNCTGRVNTVTSEIIKLLKESGCTSIYYGLESGNQKILEMMSKKTTLEQIDEAVRLTREVDIYCEFGVMFGQPGENAETLQDSIDLLKRLAYGRYRSQKIFGCIPFPGTGLYDWCKQPGRLKDDEDFYNRYICQDWSLGEIPVNMTDLPQHEVGERFKQANDDLSSFYRRKVAVDWVKYYGGDVDGVDESGRHLRHIQDRVEASASTFDTSGRTG